jgi:hypothetical protein
MQKAVRQFLKMRVHPGGTNLLDPTANMAANALNITLNAAAQTHTPTTHADKLPFAFDGTSP